LTPEGKETVLYNFCAQANCTDGENPAAGVIFDQKRNLYGTTVYGGVVNDEHCLDTCGVVFKVTPKGKETVLYTFCLQINCTDGGNPRAGLVFDQKGNLYGTTLYGGVHNGVYCGFGCGVVFKITPEGKYTVLYSFCSQNNCTDGASPYSALVLDQKGNLYGTTWGGGAHSGQYCVIGCGVVFKITPGGKESVLYNFCAQNNCADGAYPTAGLVFDQKGNLYGTTQAGGANLGGTAFKLSPKGKETILHSFCPPSFCFDGTGPEARLVLDQKGNLYGTTYYGGAYEAGGVFKLTP
jgi:uncharacterized repeat protein (TIGR03803 family)